MKSVLISLLILATAFAPSAAAACDTEATAGPDSECVVTRRGAVQGVWFELGVANQLRLDSEAVEELHLQLDLYEVLEAEREEQVGILRAAADASAEATSICETAWEGEVQQRERREARSGQWFRSPIVWFAGGVVLGFAGATVGIVAAN